MPQFEVQAPSGDAEVTRIRARSAEEAARTSLGLPNDVLIVLEKPLDPMDQLAGWSDVRVEGETKGRVRAFQRMRFRRE